MIMALLPLTVSAVYFFENPHCTTLVGYFMHHQLYTVIACCLQVSTCLMVMIQVLLPLHNFPTDVTISSFFYLLPFLWREKVHLCFRSEDRFSVSPKFFHRFYEFSDTIPPVDPLNRHVELRDWRCDLVGHSTGDMPCCFPCCRYPSSFIAPLIWYRLNNCLNVSSWRGTNFFHLKIMPIM